MDCKFHKLRLTTFSAPRKKCPHRLDTITQQRFQINGLQLSLLSRHPQLGNTWEHLEKEPLLDSRLRAGVSRESHACKPERRLDSSVPPRLLRNLGVVRRYRRRWTRVCGEIDARSGERDG
jgi:hypothetical protein